MSLAQRQVALTIVGLFVLQLLWHGLLVPASQGAWLIAALFALPIIPALMLLARRHRRAGFWGSVAALLYFCHGVMEAWSSVQARVPAFIEITLSVWLIVAASWDGMRARFARKL